MILGCGERLLGGTVPPLLEQGILRRHPSLSQALLGGIIRLSGLHEEINLRIPAGTSSHTELTLSGRGIKHMESYNTYGDHVVRVMIRMPSRMSDEQMELVRQFAYLERDTPGTITGVDKSRFWEKSGESDQRSSAGQASQAESDDARGTLSKIVDAISSNETVKMISNNETVKKITKKIFG